LNVRALATATIVALCFLPTALPAQQPSAALPYTVVTRDARRPLATRLVGGQEMFALDDLARLFNLTVREDAAAGGLTLTTGAQTIVLSAQQPLASVSGRMISLPAAPVREGRAWYVPVDFVGRALAAVLPGGLELRKPSRLIVAGGVRLPRIAARSDAAGPGTTRITIDVAPPTPHSITQEATRLLVRFDADALDIAELRVTPNDTVLGVHQGDPPGVLAIDVSARFASFRASDQPPPTPGSARIFVDVIAQTEAPPPGGPPAGVPPVPGIPETPPLLDLPTPGGLRAIVVDAGHGGDDTGAKGAQGALEKNVTLSVARKLKGALEARLGVRVLLTRDGDQAVASDQRAALANNNKADLFISLHANASLRPAVAGAEVFYLNLEGYGDQAQRASQGSADALPVLGGGNREIEITPWEMAQARHIDQSAVFAQAIEEALRERVPMSPRALQKAPFRVLVGANMPAVLVELGFLTNAQQEQQLTGDQHQNVLVQALVEGIVRYRAASGGTR